MAVADSSRPAFKTAIGLAKSPFREQVSEHDCVPTCFLNAYSYLFQRKEIPFAVVQRTYLYCLDSDDGTTDFGIKLLGNWVSEYRHKSFDLLAEFYDGDRVHLRRGNPISQCLNRGGVALLRVTHQGRRMGRRSWHYILGLTVADGWIYCYDPHPRTIRSNKPGRYEFTRGGGDRVPNLRIACSWLDTNSDAEQFRLGSKLQRSCMLIERS